MPSWLSHFRYTATARFGQGQHRSGRARHDSLVIPGASRNWAYTQGFGLPTLSVRAIAPKSKIRNHGERGFAVPVHPRRTTQRCVTLPCKPRSRPGSDARAGLPGIARQRRFLRWFLSVVKIHSKKIAQLPILVRLPPKAINRSGANPARMIARRSPMFHPPVPAVAMIPPRSASLLAESSIVAIA